MKMQPRQELLEIWRATTQLCHRNGTWHWGGRGGSNSISDAEQLLCLLQPATSSRRFALEQPDETAEDALAALRAVGDAVEIPQVVVRVAADYLERYTGEYGTPVFAGGGRFVDADQTPTDFPLAVDVVESFSTSITLSLAIIGFVRVFRTVVTRVRLRDQLDTVEQMASRRLTAAMVGLLRSFSVNVFDVDSPDGQFLIEMVNQSRLPTRRVAEELRRQLRDVRSALGEVGIGSGLDGVEALGNPDRLFECGWSWGVVKDAPEVDTAELIGVQRDGVAQDAPYLYFSLTALDGIEELFSERTRILGLLNEEQQRLSRALQLRWDSTQRYWSTIAGFGTGRWPLENLPWMTTDGQESDYFSLLVTSITTQDLIRRWSTDTELNRVARVLGELAGRARITRRAFAAADAAVRLHDPGVLIELNGSEKAGSGRLFWSCTDFSPLLLKRTLRLAALMRNPALRRDLLLFADLTWEHLLQRRIADGPARNLWDQPANVYDAGVPRYDEPLWSYTRRVTECLVTAANVLGGTPLRSDRLADLAADLLLEAEHVYDRELLNGSETVGVAMRQHLQEVEANLRRAREIIDTRPGTAVTLAEQVLLKLDRLAAARGEVG